MNSIARRALTIPPPPPHPAQAALADLIPERARALGCTDFESYCDLIDREATAHLSEGLAERNIRIRQMRRPKPFYERTRSIACLSVPLNRGRTMFAKVDAADWIEMQETGATGLWQCVDTFSGFYVYTSMPLKRQAETQKIAVPRLILGLGQRERVGFADGDMLNLRRSNMLKCASDNGAGNTKDQDARQVAREAAARRDQMVAEGRTSDSLN